ncbi:TadA family conjugal transfer-associated ATPase [Timonella sp. A28]|uniref:TadA family conjugal transfer-associated ATPase n=1 Tax=Timonella sp. A28 TaxID=3442640 RepID=UPI003EB86495
MTDKLATIRHALADSTATLNKHDIQKVVEDQQLVFGDDAITHLTTQATHELFGSGPLQPYLNDPQVTDVLVNDVDDIWVDKGNGLERINLNLGDAQQLRALAVRLAAQAGTRLDDSHPAVDGQLHDGTRLHALLHPLSETPALISLRTIRSTALTLDELTHLGSLHPLWRPLIHEFINKKLNFLVSGATGTGKTTLLSTLLSLVPSHERIITIEESREIKPTHPHVLRLETKKNNIEGHGAVTQAELVRHTLRMRPDRIVVGECRGPEIRDMLTALNTGHQGGCGTIHANSAQDVPARLEALGALAHLNPDALAKQAASALDIIIHLTRPTVHGTQQRRISEIAVLHINEHGTLVAKPALTWAKTGNIHVGAGISQLSELIHVNEHQLTTLMQSHNRKEHR